MKEVYSLRHYVDNLLMDRDDYYDYSNKKGHRRVCDLKSLLGMGSSIRLTDDDPILCILVEILLDYFDCPPDSLGGHSGAVFFKKLCEYKNSPKVKTDGHFQYPDETVLDFFLFFLKHPLWMDSDKYTDSEKKETLSYLNTYYQTLAFWSTMRVNKDFRFYFDSDISKFAKALYFRNYLPDMDDYIYAMAMPEDIVEEFKNTYVLYDLSQL